MSAAAASTDIQPWAKAVQDAAEQFNAIAVPDGNIVRFQSEANFAMQRIEADTTLQGCAIASVRNALINVASVGLTLNPAMKLAYLVPRKDKKSGQMLCCLDISYIGLVKVATDSGGVLAVAATIVRENDAFTWNGEFEKPTHIYDPFADEKSRGAMRGVYSTAMLPNGTVKIDAIGMEEIAKIRAVSQASAGPAWNGWFEEMCKKSVLKRASKLWPRTERLAKAEAILNEHQGNETVIDGTTGEVIPMPQSKSAPAAPASAPPPPAGQGGVASDAGGKPMSPGQSRLIKAKLSAAALTELDFEAAHPQWSLEPKDGRDLVPMGEVNNVLAWVESHKKN